MCERLEKASLRHQVVSVSECVRDLRKNLYVIKWWVCQNVWETGERVSTSSSGECVRMCERLEEESLRHQVVSLTECVRDWRKSLYDIEWLVWQNVWETGERVSTSSSGECVRMYERLEEESLRHQVVSLTECVRDWRKSLYVIKWWVCQNVWETGGRISTSSSG